jgi:hypothetical protein
VLWYNFRRLGFCNSSDFSSLGVGVEEFADYFANVPVPSVQIPTALEHISGFSFRHIGLVERFLAFKSIIANAVGADGFSVNFFKLLFPLICCYVLHVFNHAITSYIIWPVDFRPITIVSVLSKAFERILHDQVLKLSMVAICGRIFSLVSDVGIEPRLLWSDLLRI